MRRNSGFTTTELMVTLGIFAILAAVAVPNFMGWRGGANLRGAAKNLKSDLNLARLSAARESGLVNVEFFSDRYFIYLDVDRSDNLNGGDKSIRSRTLPPGVQIDIANTTFPVNGAGDPRTSFNSRGLPEPGRTGDVSLIGKGCKSRTISMNRLGRLAP